MDAPRIPRIQNEVSMDKPRVQEYSYSPNGCFDEMATGKGVTPLPSPENSESSCFSVDTSSIKVREPSAELRDSCVL